MGPIRSTIRNLLIKTIGRLRTPPWENSDEPIYRFITYHRIKADQIVSFKRQLDRLQNGFNIVSPNEFTQDQGRTNTLNLVLSFDDGYREWESIVLKELKKRSIKGLFFISPDFVGLEGKEAETFCRNHLNIEPTSPLTSEGVKKIHDYGHTIGNHLLTHVDLRDVKEPDIFEREFHETQNFFDDKFGIRPDWVAYPFADYFKAPDPLADTASNYFDYGVTLIPGWNRAGESNHLLHRDGFSPTFSSNLEEAWLKGGYDPVFELSHLVKP